MSHIELYTLSTAIFPWKTRKSKALFSPENPETENCWVTRPFSRLFSELEPRQYETVDQSAGDFAF